MPERYSLPNRLGDVIQLIQLFGLSQEFQRGNAALTREIGPPSSMPQGTWIEVTRQHPEFFRVTGGVPGQEVMCLAIRYITPDPHPPVRSPVVELLIKTAVDLHEAELRRLDSLREAELRRQERRNVLVAALIAGFSAIIANFVAAVIKPR